MSVKSILQTYALACTPNVFFRRRHEFNITADNSQFPAIVIIENDDLGFQLDGNNNQHDYDIFYIQFLDILPDVSLADNADTRYDDIESMRSLAAKFNDLLINSNDVSLSSSQIPGTRVIEAYDVKAYGVELKYQLSLVQPRGCLN